jgi:hypothetical protein
MAIPTSRDDFKEYCLRALGKPVLQINVEDTQVEDRIDEAVYLYQQFHMDAVVKTYMKHRITASTMKFAGPVTGAFVNGESIIGATSKQTGMVSGYDANTNNSLLFITSGSPQNTNTISDNSYSDTSFTVDFRDGELVTGQKSGATGTIATSNVTVQGITLGDWDNRWIPIPDAVISITKVLLPFDGGTSRGGDYLFDYQAQFNMSLVANFTSQSIIPYVVGRQYQTLVSDTFRGRPGIRFERHMNRLYIDVAWDRLLSVGSYWLIEGYRTIDPTTFPDVWSDRWLQKYAQALIKKQWATNLSKFGGIALPGGVTLNGRDMMNDAVQEIKDLEEQLQTTHQLPIDFIVG